MAHSSKQEMHLQKYIRCLLRPDDARFIPHAELEYYPKWPALWQRLLPALTEQPKEPNRMSYIIIARNPRTDGIETP